MQKIRRQWNRPGESAIFIVLALILVGFLVWLLSLLPQTKIKTSSSNSNNYFSSYHSSYERTMQETRGLIIFSVVLIAMFIAASIGIAIYFIVGGLKSKKVKKLGHMSVCEVTRVEIHHYHRSLCRSNYKCAVKYRGDSGEDLTFEVRFPLDKIDNLEKGMKFKCYVYQDDCYLDPDNLIQVYDGIEEGF